MCVCVSVSFQELVPTHLRVFRPSSAGVCSNARVHFRTASCVAPEWREIAVAESSNPSRELIITNVLFIF